MFGMENNVQYISVEEAKSEILSWVTSILSDYMDENDQSKLVNMKNFVSCNEEEKEYFIELTREDFDFLVSYGGYDVRKEFQSLTGVRTYFYN